MWGDDLRRLSCRRGRVVHGNSVISCQASQSACIPLPDGAEFPCAVAAVHLSENHRSLGGGVGDREVKSVRTGIEIMDGDMERRELPKTATVGGTRDENLLDRGFDCSEIDFERIDGLDADCLTEELHRARRVSRLVEEDEVGVRANFS